MCLSVCEWQMEQVYADAFEVSGSELFLPHTFTTDDDETRLKGR